MKKIILLLVLLLSIQSQSQTYVKVNALTTLLTIPNVGIETSIGKKSTFQVDVLASFWKSINNLPAQFVTITPEYRYHFNEKYDGFYAGVNVGGSIYKVSKGIHRQLDQYEKGVGYMIGATIGYQKEISKKVLIELFLGGGTHQGFYKGYNIDTGERYDMAKKYNKSGEWLPYRGGVMISYRIN
jgi:opacity protein-like surface antigen